MTLKTTLLSATALLFSAGAAAAMPAVTESDLNLRSGPGTEYGVVATIPGGSTVDAMSCDGGWCHVAYGETEGYASQHYLQMAAAAPNAGVVVEGPTVYPYDDYDYGYDYGPSFGLYTSPVFGHRPRWHGEHHAANWHGRWTGPNHAGNWHGGNLGNPGNTAANRSAGVAGPPARWQRPGTGIGPLGNAGRSAPAGLHSGGAPMGVHSGGAPIGGHGGGMSVRAGAHGGGNGSAGLSVRGHK